VARRASPDDERAITLAVNEGEPQPVPHKAELHALVAGGQLSEREREVARLVAQGFTSREMAKRLTITERTVNTHLERIRDKLGVRPRAQITAWLMRSGLAADDASSARGSATLPASDQ
jgi:DNA-binding CsgD family transcriptional regulator